MTQPTRGVLYVVVCAALPAPDVVHFVPAAQERGWVVCVVATPAVAPWLDIATLEQITGHAVRTAYKRPGDPDVLPPADAIIVAPATSNTVAKWASGISDNLALGIITEAVGRRTPTVALPFLNRAQARHPAFARHVGALRDSGVRVLLGPDVMELPEPGSGRPEAFPWTLALDELDRLTAAGPS